MVYDPVVRDHRERDREGDELSADGIEERARARPCGGHVVDVERGHQQGERERVGRVDEADGAVELRVVALVRSPRVQQRVSASHDAASVNTTQASIALAAGARLRPVLEVVARLVLGGLLAGASLAKLASPASSRAAMATFGIDGRRPQAIAWALLIACELGLAAGVIAGSATAAYLAAALMATFAATMVGAILRGPRRRPLRLLRRPLDRRLVRASPATSRSPPRSPRSRRCRPRTCPPTSGSASGSCSPLLACAGLAVAVLALAREVGLLRLRLGNGERARDRRGGPAAVLRGRGDRPLRARPGGAPGPRRLHLRGLSRLPLARALDPGAGQRPPGRGRDASTRSTTRRSGTSSGSRAARSRSRSTSRASCWRRGRSTTSPSSRACSRPPERRRAERELAGVVGV